MAVSATTSRVGCRNCAQRYKGSDGRRRCRISGGIARLTHNAERVCEKFIHDVNRKEATCSSTS